MPKKTDTNQAEIVAALRAAGCSVQDLHTVGKGCPDILVGYTVRRYDPALHGGQNYLPGPRNFLFEIKSRGGKLTGKEPAWHAAWKGQVAVIYSAEEALKIMGVIE